MGNHAAGQAMDRAAQQAVQTRKPGERAIEILDKICKPFRGADAEFESTNPENTDQVHPEFDDCRHPHPKAALGMLLLEAFAPNGLADLERYSPMLSDGPDADDACDLWWDEILEPFTNRYGFC